tara:strand:- start:449 stop:676 length:228 start_codon:yes stop_codon:yes gene_type:complete
MCQLATGSKFKLLRALIAEVQPTIKIINSEKKYPSMPEVKALKAMAITLQCKILERDGYANFADLIKRKAINAGL